MLMCIVRRSPYLLGHHGGSWANRAPPPEVAGRDGGPKGSCRRWSPSTHRLRCRQPEAARMARKTTRKTGTRGAERLAVPPRGAGTRVTIVCLAGCEVGAAAAVESGGGAWWGGVVFWPCAAAHPRWFELPAAETEARCRQRRFPRDDPELVCAQTASNAAACG